MGQSKRAPLVDVCKWVLNTQNMFGMIVVAKSFKVTRISNERDSTENGLASLAQAEHEQ